MFTTVRAGRPAAHTAGAAPLHNSARLLSRRQSPLSPIPGPKGHAPGPTCRRVEEPSNPGPNHLWSLGEERGCKVFASLAPPRTGLAFRVGCFLEERAECLDQDAAGR